MEIFKLFYSFTLPWLVGHQALGLILNKRRLSLPLAISISFGLGFGILSQSMLILGALNIKYTFFNISVFLLFILILFMLLSKNKYSSKDKDLYCFQQNKSVKINSVSFFFILLSLIIIVYYLSFSLWAVLNIPAFGWDSISTCIYNAKIIYFDGSLKSLPYFSHPSYPLHIPLITSWVSFVLGEWNDQFFKIIFPLTFLSFSIIYYEFLSSKTNKIWALLGTVLLFSSNLLCIHLFVEYRDLTLMYYNCLVIIFLLVWKDERHDSFLILASLSSGFGTFVKQEGMAYFPIHFLIMLFILIFHKKSGTKKITHILKFLIPSISLFSIFYLLKITQNINGSEYFIIDLSSAFSRIPLVFDAFFTILYLSANWNILWLFLYVSIIFNTKKITKSPDIQVLLISILLFLGMLMTISIIVGNDFIIHPLDISRVLLHFFPLCPLAIILLNYFPQKN